MTLTASADTSMFLCAFRRVSSALRQEPSPRQLVLVNWSTNFQSTNYQLPNYQPESMRCLSPMLCRFTSYSPD